MSDKPIRWVVSGSGYSIKQDIDDPKLILEYKGCYAPLDVEAFQDWLEEADYLCEAHNRDIDNE